MGKRVFITVAEVSGDKHAAHLIESLRLLDPTLRIEGLGGPAMAAAGAHLHHETVGGAAMAWNGILRVAEVFRMLKWTRRHFRTERPDLQICVDSPAMNFHFAKAAHSLGVPVLYYVAPQLWAWREGRMKKLRRSVDRVACILPFEEAYFRAHGVNATFVGHPIFDELPTGRDGQPPRERPAEAPVLGLLPGSRKSEAQQNFAHLLDVGRRVQAAFPAAKFLVPTTTATHPVVAEMVASSWPGGSLEYRQDAFNELVPQCDLCVTVSGTATLHVAGFGVPMIVVYRASPLLWHAVGRWLMKTRTFALVNILAAGRPPDGRADAASHVVPEVVPWYGSNAKVADMAIDLLRHPEKLRQQQERLAQLVKTLDRPGASERVARMALEMLNGVSPQDVQHE